MVRQWSTLRSTWNLKTITCIKLVKNNSGSQLILSTACKNAARLVNSRVETHQRSFSTKPKRVTLVWQILRKSVEESDMALSGPKTFNQLVPIPFRGSQRHSLHGERNKRASKCLFSRAMDHRLWISLGVIYSLTMTTPCLQRLTASMISPLQIFQTYCL